MLHGVGGPGSGVRLRLVELSLRPALAEQVPALVELLLELAKSTGVGGGLVVAEPVLLVDELMDAREDVLVGHGPSVGRFCPRRTASMTGIAAGEPAVDRT